MINNENEIPILAYAFIGITTLVLSYVTIMDDGEKIEGTSTGSATSMLPNVNLFGNSSSTPATESNNAAVPSALNSLNPFSGTNAEQKTVGGKKTKHNRHKKKQTKRRNLR